MLCGAQVQQQVNAWCTGATPKMLGAEEDLLGSGDPPAIQFNSIQFFYPTRGNFAGVVVGSWNNEDIKLTEQYNKRNTTNKRVLP